MYIPGVRRGEEPTMAGREKARGRKDAAAGKVKKRVGEATGDPRMAQEGAMQQRRGNLRLAFEKVKDAFRR
jgi:uncharacterized protein YjbJ (UPF0337 family)